ncbi:MAG: recombinase family protein [Acidimicrobiales bacterium]
MSTPPPTLACAAYIRTSTDDQQSPEDSKRWQLDIVTRLVTPAGGAIVATYHDIDVTRERPWARRPEASRLLADAANPARGWQALVIAEPQRAFSGGQFQLVFPQLTHYGVDLWVPELGGRVDPDSEGHEMLMSLFGGLSKAERRRLQIRTHNAVLAHGAAGRWLGGRPNYGYRLVDTPVPHPQRQKAAAGIKLRILEPDPDTAPVVRRIFEMFDQGLGYRTIASILEREGLASAGEVGPTRHPRSAGVWGGSAVRAILTNPRYLGHQVVGRQRRRDELLDPTDPPPAPPAGSAGNRPATGSPPTNPPGRHWSSRTCGAGQRPHHQQPRPATAPPAGCARRVPAGWSGPLLGMRAVDARRHPQGQAVLPVQQPTPRLRRHRPPPHHRHPRGTHPRRPRPLARPAHRTRPTQLHRRRRARR